MSLQDVEIRVEADVVNRPPPTLDITWEGQQEHSQKNSISTNSSDAENARTPSGGAGMPPLHSSRSCRGLGMVSSTATIPNPQGPLGGVHEESPRSSKLMGPSSRHHERLSWDTQDNGSGWNSTTIKTRTVETVESGSWTTRNGTRDAGHPELELDESAHFESVWKKEFSIENSLRALKEQNTLEEKDDGANTSSQDDPWNVNKTFDHVGTILKQQFARKSEASENSRDEHSPSIDISNKRQGDGDPEDDKGKIRRANLVFVMAVLLLAVMLAIDFISVLWLQVFWPSLDFLCLPADSLDPGQCLSYIGVRQEPYNLLWYTLSMYTVFLVVALYDRYSISRYHAMDYLLTRVYNLLWYPWLTFVMVASWTVLLRHKNMCNTATAFSSMRSWSYLTERLHFLIHVVRVICAFIVLLGMETELKSRIQAAVSVNKRRFIDPSSSLNLDLTYICDRLVAMAIPCSNAVIYRNDIREVSRFFSTRHYSRFLIFNLCEDHEEGGNGNYDINYFFGQVRRLPFYDHNTPTLVKLMGFVRDATRWLNKGPDYLVAVHCQGGKGRTGMFCGALMICTGFIECESDAVLYFGHRRTDEKKPGQVFQSVAAPCQKRYLGYVEDIVSGFNYATTVYLLLTNVTIRTIPMHNKRNDVYITFVIENSGILEYDHAKANGFVRLKRAKNLDGKQMDVSEMAFAIDVNHIMVHGDVQIRFYYFNHDPNDVQKSFKSHAENVTTDCKLGKGARTIRYGDIVGKQFAFVAFNTAFIPNPELPLTFGKEQVDVAYQQPSSRIHDKFSLSFSFLDTSGGFVAPGSTTPRSKIGRAMHALTRTNFEANPAGFTQQIHAERLTNQFFNARTKSDASNSTSGGSADPWMRHSDNSSIVSPEQGRDVSPNRSRSITPSRLVQPATHEVWYRRVQAVAFLHQRDQVKTMFNQLCPHVKTYKYGDIIYRDSDALQPRKVLHFIQTGRARWESAKWNHSFVTTSLDQFNLIGPGNVYDWSTFLLGKNDMSSGRVLRAVSAEVHVISVYFEDRQESIGKRSIPPPLPPAPQPPLVHASTVVRPLQDRAASGSPLNHDASDLHKGPQLGTSGSAPALIGSMCGSFLSRTNAVRPAKRSEPELSAKPVQGPSAPPVQSKGITETQMSALYEYLAISLQAMDTRLNKELSILKERPAVGRLDSRIAVDADGKRGLAILQACGLSLVEETKRIFKEVGLFRVSADETGTFASARDLNLRPPPKAFAVGSNLVASFLGNRHDSTRRHSNPGGSDCDKQRIQFGSVYTYNTLLVFCSLQAKDKQEVIDRDSKLLMAQCVPVRFKLIHKVSRHDNIVSVTVKCDEFEQALNDFHKESQRTNAVKGVSDRLLKTFLKSGSDSFSLGTPSSGGKPSREKEIKLQMIMKDAKQAVEMSKLLIEYMKTVVDQRQKYKKTVSLPSEYKGFGYFVAADDDAEMSKFMSMLYEEGTVEVYQKGNVILQIGETHRALCHVISGSASAMSQSGSVLYELEKGDIFGKSSVLGSHTRGSLTKVVAVTNCSILRVTGRQVQSISETIPHASSRFYRRLAVTMAKQVNHHWVSLLKEITTPHEFESNRAGEFEDRPPSKLGAGSTSDVMMGRTDSVASAVSANIKSGQSGKVASSIGASPVFRASSPVGLSVIDMDIARAPSATAPISPKAPADELPRKNPSPRSPRSQKQVGESMDERCERFPPANRLVSMPENQISLSVESALESPLHVEFEGIAPVDLNNGDKAADGNMC